MSDYEENTIKPLRRGIILRLLADRKDYTSNADLLLSAINRTRDGVTAYFGEIVDDLAWLERKGYVILNGDEFIVVEATKRGLRVARGEAVDRGVSRAEPRF